MVELAKMTTSLLPPIPVYTDGTARQPRNGQIAFMVWLASPRSWHMAGILPTGIGKSWIARATQVAIPGTIIITSQNAHVDQYAKTYSDLVSVKGKEHYQDEAAYRSSRARMRTKPAIFNTASWYYYLMQSKNPIKPSVIILDEADEALSLLLEFATEKIRVPQEWFKADDIIDLVEARVAEIDVRLQELWLLPKVSKKAVSQYGSQLNKMSKLFKALTTNDYSLGWEISSDKKGQPTYYAKVVPTILPEYVRQKFFGNARVVLLSATLDPHRVEELVGPGADIFELDSPFILDQRPMFTCDPLPAKPGYGTDTSINAGHVARVWNEKLKELGPTLVHVPYGQQEVYVEAFKKFTKNVYVNNPTNKDVCVARFKETGGVWIASGCNVGLDLPECRVNIIPTLQYPSLASDYVNKRKSKRGGGKWYQAETLRHLTQALGRGCRHEEDWVVNWCPDPRFWSLYNDTVKTMPKALKSCVVFSDYRFYSFPEIYGEHKPTEIKEMLETRPFAMGY